MAMQPSKPSRGFSFTDWQVAHPDDPPPGDHLDGEYDEGYDATGQLLTASFMDYAMPRAADLPMFATAISEVPSTTHPLGLRGGGEGGITPALGVIANAIVDGLREFGIIDIELPATPERVWHAIRQARAAP